MKKRGDHLISAYFAGTLDEGEPEELKKLLRNDHKLLEKFCDEADFERELREVSMAMPFPSRNQRRLRPSPKLIWGAAALLFLSLGLFGLFRHQAKVPTILADFEVSPYGKILVSGPAEGVRKMGELEKGATIRVAQGSVELHFREGVRCLLDAPSELTLQREGLVYLRGGRARFDVEEQARGFRVISGDLQLTDLGTSFGVDASQGSPEVHVLEGLVVGQGRIGRREEAQVKGGQAMVLAEKGEMIPIPIDEERFRSSLGEGIPAFHLSFDGEKEAAGNCRGSIAIRDGAQLVLGGADSPRVVPGRFGGALEFDGKKTYARTNWPGIGGSEARSISFWLKTNEGQMPNPILGWGLFGGDDQMSFFGLRLSKEGRLRMVSGRRWLEGSSVLDDGEWHHVVVVTGDYKKGAWPVTRFYIDGVPESVTPRVPMDGKAASLDTFDTVITDPNSEPLMLGRFAPAVEDRPWDLESFSGAIDEVIIAEGILVQEGVQALYEGRLEDSELDLFAKKIE